jgi:hypothetical protein
MPIWTAPRLSKPPGCGSSDANLSGQKHLVNSARERTPRLKRVAASAEGAGRRIRGMWGDKHFDELTCFLIGHRKPHGVLAGLCFKPARPATKEMAAMGKARGPG